ncbi:MAG TPA: ABC transporter permease [Stellaceae bacterium]|nr:ABC transporter permease [Stellaceae bacterium]
MKHRVPRRRPFFLAFLLPSLLAAGLFLAALGDVLQYSFRTFIPGSLDVGGFTLENFLRIGRPIYLSVLLDTVTISVLTALFTLLLSYPVAYALVRARRDWVRTLLIILAITPLFTGEIVRTYAWILVLGSNGFVNSLLKDAGLITAPLSLLYTRFGVTVALVQFSMPVMIILLATAISHVDRNCERAAANLGAPPLMVFWRVTLPLTMPGVISGTIVIFAWTMSAFSTPQLIGGGKVLMISNLVYLQGLSTFNFPFAAVLSLLALLVAMGSLGLIRPAIRRLERRVALH